MPVAPEQLRAARLAVPRLPLPAIIGFALFGLGGSVFLVYTTFSHGASGRTVAPSTDPRVYEARAVPFDVPREDDPAQRAASISRALTAAQSEGRRDDETVEPDQKTESDDRALLAESSRALRGFNGFGNFAGANNYLAISGTSLGISAQNAPSVFAAPDAEMATAAPVPETSTWMCGGALFVLIAARGVRAHWHRRRQRD